MPFVNVQNNTSNTLAVPPPVARTLRAGQTVQVFLDAAQMEDAALRAMEHDDVISIHVVPAPTNPTATLTTGGATPATIVAIPLANGEVATIKATAAARNMTDASKAAGYEKVATFRNDADTLTQIGATTSLVNHEDTAGWDVTFTSSGTDVLVQVTGEALKTIAWTVNVSVVKAPTV